MISIDLPWPPRVLSPNARPHWAALYRAKKAYKQTAKLLTLEALQGRKCYATDWLIVVKLIFHPASRRRYDADNMIASLKSGLDGLAEALDIDDSRFQLLPLSGEILDEACVTVKIG
jgi:crossover junction endodeoxyribonuclease RusA